MTRPSNLGLVFFGLLFYAVFSSLAAASDKDIEIWFGPKTWTLKPTGHGIEYTQHDFPAFIQPGAPWQVAASRISAIDLPGNIVWSYPDLPSLVAFVNRSSFKIAFSSGMLASADQCGASVEGMSRDADFNHETVKIAELWKKAGGRLDYVFMDSPFYYGHAFPGGCRYSVAETARRTVATLKGVLAYYPDVEIIDAEGPGAQPNDAWLRDMAEFLADFKRESGRPIAAIDMDLHWHDVLRPNETWQNTVRMGVASFHKQGVKAGLIIDADGPRDTWDTDEKWMNVNRLHLRDVADGHFGLDFISIASWQAVPRNNLPETSPTGFTSLIDYAFDQFKGNPKR